MLRLLHVSAACLALALSAPLYATAETSTADLLEQGQQQLDAGDLDQALTSFQLVVEHDPQSTIGYTRLGGVQILRQEYRSGIQSFQTAVLLDQNNSDAFVGMALAYIHLGQYSLARASLQEAQRVGPDRKAEIDKVLAWIDQRPTTKMH